MIKKIIVGLTLLITITANSQEKNVNDYKYVIVKEKLDLAKSNDEYQTSSLTKFLLKKKGFVVFKSDENLPEELSKNRCLALTADVIDKSSMLTVKTYILLKDCYNKEVYRSEIAKSKIKDYKKGYHESIRRAYASMADLTYSYTPIKNEDKNNTVVPNTTISSAVDAGNIVKKEIAAAVVIPSKVTLPLENKNNSNIEALSNNTLPVLYAQPKENGYQLVNAKPEVVFIILKTNSKDRFIIKNKNGNLTKTNGVWVAEFYEDSILQVKKYQIKF
jgi:hypothetical protein